MDSFLSASARYMVGMTDVRISRNPLRKEAIIILNDVEIDQYSDKYVKEIARVKKPIIVKQNPDALFIQEDEDVIAEEDSDPWIAVFTITGLTRAPKSGDRLVFNENTYVISAVKPTNRDVPVVFDCYVHPDRVNTDPLKVHSVGFIDGIHRLTFEQAKRVYLPICDIIYGGNPTQIRFDNEAWKPFQSYVRHKVKDSTVIYIKDRSNQEAEFRLEDYANKV